METMLLANTPKFGALIGLGDVVFYTLLAVLILLGIWRLWVMLRSFGRWVRSDPKHVFSQKDPYNLRKDAGQLFTRLEDDHGGDDGSGDGGDVGDGGDSIYG